MTRRSIFAFAILLAALVLLGLALTFPVPDGSFVWDSKFFLN